MVWIGKVYPKAALHKVKNALLYVRNYQIKIVSDKACQAHCSYQAVIYRHFYREMRGSPCHCQRRNNPTVSFHFVRVQMLTPSGACK